MVGPFAAGKTALIRTVSDTPVVGTEVATSGHEAAVKATTTVGIEHGVYRLVDGELTVELLLFGTPGQCRFEAVRQVAALGVEGVLLVVDGTRPDTWAEARRLWCAVGLDGGHAAGPVPTVVAVNRWPEGGALPDGLSAALDMPPGTAWCAGDVVEPPEARRIVATLLDAVLDRLPEDAA